jgi:dTDP-glucose 4,6-dehydratase
MLIITGGAGFIGSNFVIDWLTHSDEPIINLDKLTWTKPLRGIVWCLDRPLGSW